MNSLDAIQPNEVESMMRIRQFARQYTYEQDHVEQVLKLSELLFEKLTAVHGLNAEALYILRCAAVLHDIGWINGQHKHHKTAMRLVLDAEDLPLTQEQQAMTALIARYHRKAPPKPTHDIYQERSPEQQRQIQFLAGILRIADGLDRTHQSVVEDVDVRIFEDTITIRCRVIRGTGQSELTAAKKKADVFETISRRTLYFSASEKGSL